MRVLSGTHGTGAVVRVLIDLSNGEREWTTVGVSENIIEASWEALVDGYTFGLLHPRTSGMLSRCRGREARSRSARPMLDDARAIAEVHVRVVALGLSRPSARRDARRARRRRARGSDGATTMSDPSTSVLVAIDRDAVVGFASAGPPMTTMRPPAPLRALRDLPREPMRPAGGSAAACWSARSRRCAPRGSPGRACGCSSRTHGRERFYERAGWTWDGTRSSHQVQCSNLPIVRYVRDL